MSLLITCLIVIHVLSAIIGLGPSFAFPVVGSAARTKDQLLLVSHLMDKLENYPKAGGLVLLVTGVLLMFLAGYGFHTGWLDVSIVLFVIIEIIAYGVVGRGMAEAGRILNTATGTEVPAAYMAATRKMVPFHMVMYVLSIGIVILMVAKPF